MALAVAALCKSVLRPLGMDLNLTFGTQYKPPPGLEKGNNWSRGHRQAVKDLGRSGPYLLRV